MHIYKNISVSISLLMGFVATINAEQLLVGEPQNIKIVNGAEQLLRVTHDIPEYAQASIELTRLPEPQKMLYDAIVNNSTKDILQAVKLGANVNFDIDGKLPILIAMALKKMNSIEVLKKCGAVIPDLKTMMYRAILNDSPDEIRYALNVGANINEGGLDVARTFARYNAIKTLLECGAKSSVSQALKSMMIGDLKSAILLFKQVPANGPSTKELLAWEHENKDVFEYAVTQIDSFGVRDLLLEFIQALIDHGYDINTNVYDKVSSHLHYGIHNQKPRSAWLSALDSPYFSTEILEILMRNGANPNQVIYGGHLCTGNPLMWAIYHNNIKAVKYLLDVGADVNKQVTYASHPRNATQGTLLSYTRTLKGVDNHEIIALLMKYGAR